MAGLAPATSMTERWQGGGEERSCVKTILLQRMPSVKSVRGVAREHAQMTDEGSSVTLIFYRINPKWWTEPALNLASAVAQMSNLTHCEISIGEVKPQT